MSHIARNLETGAGQQMFQLIQEKITQRAGLNDAVVIEIINQLDVVALLGRTPSHDAVCPAQMVPIWKT